MRFENSLTFVRSLKGAPASILWAFAFTRAVMTALELQEWTGYKGDNITVAVRLLVNLGWLVALSPRGPWCLAEGRQLPLMELVEKVDQFTRGESDLIGVRATTTTAMEERKGDYSAVVVIKAANPIKSESVVYETLGVTFEKNLQECRLSGIGEPKASQISKLPWVSPELIKAHKDSLYADETIGLAIRRIESDELPRLWLEEARNIPRPVRAGKEIIDGDESEDL